LQIPVRARFGQAKPYTSIPRINWGHPLAKGLVSYLHDCGGGVVIDLVTGKLCKVVSFGTLTNNPRITPTVLGGTAWNSNGGQAGNNGNSWGIVAPIASIQDNLTNAAPYSFASGYMPRGAIASSVVFGTIFCFSDTTGANVPFYMGIDDSNHLAIIFSNGSLRTIAVSPPVNGYATTAGVLTSATSGTCYHVDAVNGFNSQTNTETTYSFTGHQGCLYTDNVPGSNVGGVDSAFNGTIFYGAAWKNRALTAAEVRLLHQDPWCLLVYAEDEAFNTLKGTTGGIAYTLACAKGTFIETGITTALRAARTESAAPATFSLTGVATAFKYNRNLPSATGVFALNGIAAALRAVRTLPAVTGVFTLNGFATALRAARTLPAATSAFALNGFATALRAVRTTAAATAAFVLSGLTTALTWSGSSGYKLTVSTGAFTLTGIAAGYRRALVASTVAGSFLLSGLATTLRSARLCSATVGTFTLTGIAAAVRAARAVVAAKGTFALTGIAAGLLTPIHRLTVTAGTLLLSGQAALLRAARLPLTAATGLFAETGFAARLARGCAVPTVRGQFLLAGSAATLVYRPVQTYAMAAVPGRFTLSGAAVWLNRSEPQPGELRYGTRAYAPRRGWG
jgi:hypothetical protein